MIPPVMLGLVLAFAAWAGGTTESWSLRAVQAAMFVVTGLALLEARRRREDGEPYALWQWRWGAPLLALAAFILLQAANASHTFSLQDEGLTPRPHLAWLPASVAAGVSLEALGKLVTYAAVMALARFLVRGRAGHLVFCGGLVLAGAAMGVDAIAQRARTTDPFALPMTGAFVNANNFAAYANLLLPVALGLGRAAHLRALRLQERSHPGFLFYTAAAALAAAVLVSGSRTGVLVTVGLVLAWLLIEAFMGRSEREVGSGGLAAAALVSAAVAAVLLLYTGVAVLGRDFGAAGGLLAGVHGRAVALEATLHMWQDRWLTGTGAGTFACAFPYYRPASIAQLYFRYAHHDGLQYAAELGVLGGALLGALVAGSLTRGRAARTRLEERSAEAGRQRRSTPLRVRHERRGLALALAGLAAHSFLDFPLHIPAVALLAAAWAGLLGQTDPGG